MERELITQGCAARGIGVDRKRRELRQSPESIDDGVRAALGLIAPAGSSLGWPLPEDV